MNPGEVVWRPSPEDAAATRVGRFMAAHGISSIGELRARSVAEPEWFWDAVVGFLGLEWFTPWDRVLDVSGGMPWAKWFVGGTLNVAHNCLDRHAIERPDDVALVWEGEDGAVRRWTWATLRGEADACAALLAERGIGVGDSVGIFMPMVPETVAALLAVAKLGAIFLPLFSGYGVGAVATRLTDGDAKAVVTADGCLRRGRPVPLLPVLREAVGQLPYVHTIVVVPRLGEGPGADGREVAWPATLAGLGSDLDSAGAAGRAGARPASGTSGASGRAAGPGSSGAAAGRASAPSHGPPPAGRGGRGLVRFPARPVDSEHPLFVAYTSGTTGRPKGSVHVHGGFLVKIAEEVAFQFDAGPGTRLFWFTDMGWIMGPWEVVGALANGATLCLYEGAPDWPGPDRLWAYVERHEVNVLGISPTLVRALLPHGRGPVDAHDLSSLRVLGSTGEPWNLDPWRWFFEVVGGGRCPVVNISGGTEVGACFLSPHPVEPLKPMTLGGPALGMAVDVYGDDGKPLRGAVGELVCTKPWPGMTRGLWRDPGRYLETYWSRWPDVWVHGDWASVDDDGSWFLHGRSDDTIKVAGKRLGPAEVESVLVGHPAVVEAAAVGLPDETKGEALWAYVVLAAGADAPMDAGDGLRAELADLVAEALGKSFRPSGVRFVTALPKTRNAKVLRRAIRAAATGAEPGDLSSLEDPSAVDAVRAAR